MSEKKNPLKNIEIRQTEYGEVYRVRFAFKGKKYTATRDTLGEAITWRDKSKATLRSGGVLDGDTPSGDMTFGEATDKYIHFASDRARNTITNYRHAQKQLLDYFSEHRLLSSIKPMDIHNYIEHRRNKDEVGASKMYLELSFVRMLYKTTSSPNFSLI